VLPIDGYPIRFLPDGSVETKNLGMITHWGLTGEGSLELRDKTGRVVYSFRYDSRKGIYSLRYEGGSVKGHLVLIGPAGSDFGSYVPPEEQ
jgi:hypothetical protein